MQETQVPSTGQEDLPGVGNGNPLQHFCMEKNGDLPNPEIENMSLMSPALAGKFFTTSTTWEALFKNTCML